MKTTAFSMLFVLAIATMTTVAVQNVSAHDHYIAPGHSHGTPKLGFYGYIVPHRGMVITRVMPGTEASRIGLERGDVILSINGQQLCHDGDYERALRRSHGHLDLRVRDVRGTGVHLLHAHLYSSGPQLYRSAQRF